MSTIVLPEDFAYSSYVANRNLCDFSAISFFEFQKFSSSRQHFASGAWFEVIAFVEKQNQKKGKALMHDWNATKDERKSYWRDKEQSEKRTEHLAALEDHARKQTLDAAQKVDYDTKKLVDSIINGSSEPGSASLPQIELKRPQPLEPTHTTVGENDRQSPRPSQDISRSDYGDTVSDSLNLSADETNDRLPAPPAPKSSSSSSVKRKYDEVEGTLVQQETLLNPFIDSEESNIPNYEYVKKAEGADAVKLAKERQFPSVDLNTKWPSFDSICSRVFTADTSSYEAVRIAILHYFSFYSTIPTDLSEREGFVDMPWTFIRGALTLAKIKTRMLEVAIERNRERKNEGKLPKEHQDIARKADGVGLLRGNQIYVAESALIYNATHDKAHEDTWKVKRAMRDSWVSQVKSICRMAHPPPNMTVFGSASHKAETKFYAMDFSGIFRVFQVNQMVVPLDKDSFAPDMRSCITRCLEFALLLIGETEKRNAAQAATYDESEELVEAAKTIPNTTPTPTKESRNKDIKASKAKKLLFTP
ncbi:hypothetical protein BGX26_005349 [Mortierella sp. AD094]|nr:hypothetical protein BGX26_005349 [Mortierella sp. AD094]